MATTRIKQSYDILQHDGSAIGLKLAGTLVTATAAELNILDGVLATAAEINRACDDSTRVVNVTTTPLAVTLASHDKKLITINKADGVTATLPAAAGTGACYKFFVSTSMSGGNLVIKVANSSDIMMGMAILGQDSADTMVQFDCAADSDTITMNGAETGGLKGAIIEIYDVATNLFHVMIRSSASGTEATPFSAAV